MNRHVVTTPPDLAQIIAIHKGLFGGWKMQADAAPGDGAQEAPEAGDAKAAPPTDWEAKAREWEAKAKQNASAAKKLAALEDANKSETQKLTDRVTAAETSAADWRGKYQSLVAKQAILDAASSANSTDPETVYLYLRDQVTVADDGTATGIDAALKQLQQRKPHLFREAPAGARDTLGGKPSAPALNSPELEKVLRRAVGA